MKFIFLSSIILELIIFYKKNPNKSKRINYINYLTLKNLKSLFFLYKIFKNVLLIFALKFGFKIS